MIEDITKILSNDAVVAAIVSAVVAFFVGLRQNYVTAVTAQRSLWINSLRENISALLSTLSSIRSLEQKERKNAQDKYQRADELIALIRLQLNPKGEIDKNLINLLPVLIKFAEKDGDGYRALEGQFVQHAQFLLKEEWEKVKYEAYLLRFSKYFSACQRKCEYQHFNEVSQKQITAVIDTK